MNLQKPLLFLVLICLSYVVAYDGRKQLQNYIVTFKAKDGERGETWHKSILSSITKDDPESRHIYSYNKVANGFAARLADDEVQALKDYPGCALIIPANEPLQLQTTHTSQFLGFRGSNGLWKRTKNMGEGIIIGVLDSGIAPGHPSFDDKGMSPPPAKWKGHCDFNSTICNNKLIGAKTMLKAGADEKKHIPPIDTTAHGTHTASTAAGNFVDNITFFGISMGEASGIAPRAHIAVYKVCNELGCQSADLLKAYEEAVNDGCDVLSVSIGSTKPIQLFDSVHSVASWYAISKGVFVSTSAGNLGPVPSIFSGNEAPWLLTVGSSTTDRRFRSTVKLGNGLEINGESVYQPMNWTSKMLPLIYITGDGAKANASHCLNGTLDKELVHGKIVVCDDGITPTSVKSFIVREAGGAGMISANTEIKQFYSSPEPYALPASGISYVDGMKIKDYIHSTKQPTATFLFKGLVYHENFSPSITITSSRGPSLHTPLILKPDIAGPGVSILGAAPSYMLPPQIVGEDKSKSFLLMTGTSMATPHLSGIAAIIKRANPSWSPSAIKSAIMTTAHVTDIDGKPIVLDHTRSPANAFDMGAGHVDPNKALDPGLVYDIDMKEYISYLCGLGFKDEEVNNIIYPEPDVQCAKVKAIPQEQLNYPSIGVSLPLQGNNSTSSIDKTIYRTVTNVGNATNATYKATVSVPKGVSVEVVPSTLKFESLNEKRTFKMIFKQQGRGGGSTGFGELKWVSGRYSVRSPIVLFFN